MNKILLLSRLLQASFLIAIIAIPITLLIFWARFPTNSGPFLADLPIMYTPGIGTKSLGFFVSLLRASLAMLACFYMAKLFQQFAKLQFFADENTKYLLRSGYSLLCYQLLKPLFDMGLAVVATFQNPPGSRFIAVTYTHVNLGLIVSALTMIVIAMILKEANKLQQENKLTI